MILDLYPGDRPFERADSGRFFGRAAEAALVGELWLNHPLTFLSGLAGVGKTSLLAAGVMPLVNDNRSLLLPIGGFSGDSGYPIAGLRRHNPYTLALLRSWSPGARVQELADWSVDDFLVRQGQGVDSSVLVLAAIDQADDLFAGPATRERDRQRRSFLRQLADALSEQPQLRLLIAARDYVLPELTEILGDGECFELGPLTVDAAQEAVERPGGFDQQAASEVVRSVRTSRVVTTRDGERRESLIIASEVEPALLQATCARLAESLHVRSDPITRREMQQRGDVDGALSGYCASAMAAVAQMHEVSVSRLRTWLINSFITQVGELEEVTEGQAAAEHVSATTTRALEDRHLLRSRADPPARRYTLISHRLIEPLRNAPDDGEVRVSPLEQLRQAGRARVVGELELATRYADEAIRVAEDEELRLHAQATSLLGDIAYENEEWVAAEQHYRRAAEIFGTAMDKGAVSQQLYAVAQTLAARGQYHAALTEISSALERDPGNPIIQAELSGMINRLSRRAKPDIDA